MAERPWTALGLAACVPLSLTPLTFLTVTAPVLAGALAVVSTRRALPARLIVFAACAGAGVALVLDWPWQVTPVCAVVVVAIWWLNVNRRAGTLRQLLTRLFPRPDRGSTTIAGITLVVAAAFLLAYFHVRGQFAFSSLTTLGLVAIPLGNAILEEVIWRGALLRLLVGSGFPTWAGLCLQALSFGLAHWHTGIPSGFLGSATSTLFGLALGVLTLRTRSLLLPIAVHWVIDMIIFFSLFG